MQFVRGTPAFFFLLLGASLLGAVACSNPTDQSESFGARLCEIHQSVLSKNLGPEKTAIQVTEKLEKELPSYYENHYLQFHLAEPHNQYEMMQAAVKIRSGEGWECEAVKEYLGV